MTFSPNLKPRENSRHDQRRLPANYRNICRIDKNKRQTTLRNQYKIAFPNVNC